MNYKVYIPQEVDNAGVTFLRERGYQIISGSGPTDEIDINELKDCDALFLRTLNITRDIMVQAPKLKVISRYGVGYDNVDLKAAKELGIYVTYSPVGNVNTVAEHAIGFIIASARFFKMCDKAVRTGNFAFRNHGVGCDLEGKILGILGMGKIGNKVASKAFHGLGMKIIAYDPYADRASIEPNIAMTNNWDEVFRESDFISVHMPVTAETREKIGAKEFALMKKTARFINCCRGELVQEKALIAALKEKRIAGAALDVFNPEPPSSDNELLKMDNVIFSPHNAGTTIEATQRVAIDTARGIDDVLNGRSPAYPVVVP